MTKLSHSLAQQIVEHITTSLQLQVSVVDPGSTVLASTNTVLVGTQLPLRQHAAGEARASADNGDRAGDISFPLLFATIAIGAVVIHNAGPQSMQLAPVAKALADLILHQATLLEQVMHQHWVRDRFMFNLLHGSLNATPDEVRHEATILGMDLDIPRVVAIIDVPLDEPVVDHPDLHARAAAQFYPFHLVEHARRVIQGHGQDIYGWCGPRWLVVLAVVDPPHIEVDRQRLAGAVQCFLAALAPELPAPPSAGIGRYYPDWAELPQSFADARFALKLGRQIYGAGRACLPKDLGLASFVCQDDAGLKSALAHRLLQPVLDKADLFATLDAFLRANLSPSLAAESLCIHRHTLDYRLAKIARLTGLDPRDFSAAAQLLAAVLWLGMDDVSVASAGVDAAEYAAVDRRSSYMIDSGLLKP